MARITQKQARKLQIRLQQAVTYWLSDMIRDRPNGEIPEDEKWLKRVETLLAATRVDSD